MSDQEKDADVPSRDPNPRGPDAPDPEKAHEQRHVVERHEEASEIPPGKKRAMAPVRWVGTNGYNYDAGRGGAAIAGIVIHTEVGTNASATGRFQTPNQASAHYGVAYDGSYVDQWVREQDTAWHCGRYFPDGSHMGNRNSIGIEHEDRGQYNSPRPDGLYEASAQLVADICRRYGLPATHNTIRGECGHREVSVVGTACPDSLDVDRIIARAQAILQPPAPPAWKTALHAEAFSVSLPAGVDLYDLTTGKATGLKVPAGDFTAAYRGTINGVDYRVTAYSFDHNTARGVRTVDVAPVPEWKRNLKADPHSFTLRTAVVLRNVDTHAPTGAVIAAGPLQVQYSTSVKGIGYWMTQYSVDRGVGNGLDQGEVAAATEQPPTPGPTPVPPTPPKPVPPVPTPTPAPSFIEQIIEFFRRLFGAKS